LEEVRVDYFDKNSLLYFLLSKYQVLTDKVEKVSKRAKGTSGKIRKISSGGPGVIFLF